ncbi:MAG: hypothetical protein HYT98_04590 [Candidatus Sungbacteria bacterium]|nr:hypothetical protein [Candidatus Sungbacteria bacterium]
MPDAVEFLKNGKFDVICLQEFPIQDLKKLNLLTAHLYFEEEFLVYNNSRKKPDRMYTVIISNTPIQNKGVIKHKNYYEDITKQDDRYQDFRADSMYADIDIGERKLRIFNVHFRCVAGPYHRLSQFREVLENFNPQRENIVCGDLNTFGHPVINIFVWKYFGFKIREFFINEKTILRATFDLNKLQNPFRGLLTFLKFPMQLDYILLPNITKIISKRRFLNSYGSDHLPISVEI